MRRNKKKLNIHTDIDSPNFFIRLIGKFIKIVELFSGKLALKLVTKLFCKPVKKRISTYQQKFYESGSNSLVSLNRYKINIWEQGKGKPVLLIHGWNNNAFNMRHIGNKLIKKGYKVIIPDLPCHGKSSGRFINQMEMGDAVQELLVYVKEKYGNFSLVTYSWGGTATLLALDQLQNKGVNLFPKNIISLALPTYSSAITDLFCKMLKLSSKLENGLLNNLSKMAMIDNRTLNEAFPLSFYKNLEQAQVLFTIIHDADDKVISIDNCEKFIEKYPNTDCLVTKGLGHLRIIKNVKVINEVVKKLSA